MSTVTIIFAGIAALGGLGGFAALAYVGVTRRKIAAEAKKLDVDADVLLSGKALEMYDRVSKEAKDARGEAQNARARIGALEAHVRELESVLRSHGITPPPFRWPPLEIAQDNGSA